MNISPDATSSPQADAMMPIHDRRTRGSYDTSSHIHLDASVSPNPHAFAPQAQQDLTMERGIPGSPPRHEPSVPIDRIEKKMSLLIGSSAANTYRSPYPAVNFPKFSDLPKELRLKIWKFAAGNQGRDVVVQLSMHYRPKIDVGSATPFTPMFHACYESRKVAFEMHVTIFEHYCAHPIYLNPITDVLFLKMGELEYYEGIGHGLYTLITGQSTTKNRQTRFPEPLLTQNPKISHVLENTVIAYLEAETSEEISPVLIIKPSGEGDEDARIHMDRIQARAQKWVFHSTFFKPVLWWDEVWPVVFNNKGEVFGRALMEQHKV